MKRFAEIVTVCILPLAGLSVHAMPLGIRTLMHAHAVTRQLHEVEQPPLQMWTVTFDANGGAFYDGLETIRQINVTNSCCIEVLPIPMRADYAFTGWFTAEDGGELMTSNTIITTNMTIYAHWQCRFIFGDSGDWTQLSDGSWMSGTTADGTTNMLSMTVIGPGTVSFRWKASCEDYFNFKGMLLRQDGLSFIVDGDEKNFINGIMSGWVEYSFEIESAGCHTLAWAYVKDISGCDGEDCAWVDSVTWTPTAAASIVVDIGGGKNISVPNTWLESHLALVASAGGNAEAALQATSANGRKVWECYVVGVDPEKATEDFKITSFPMKADGTPDLENIVFDPPQTRWNVSGARPVVKGAARLDGEWQTVTEANKATFRFFKVVVELP